MQIYHIETTVSNDGTLTIEGLPFQAGDKVEVIIRGHVPEINKGERYPLRGKPIRYDSLLRASLKMRGKYSSDCS